MVQAERTVTYEEYLAFDQAAETKHELVNGQIVAMAGGSARHSVLASRMTAALEDGLRDTCLAFQSDMRSRILATGRATYPDASVVWGPLEYDPADKTKQTITNPTLIVEVLSPTTQNDDRGAKWHHYMRLPSLLEYILVSQDEARIERFRRNAAGEWVFSLVTAGELDLVSGGKIEIAKLYARLPELE